MICVNDEHPSNMLFAIFWIFPVIINDLTPLKTPFPIEVTEEGIEICVNDEHPEKAEFPIEVTEEGIVICVNEWHSCDTLNPFEFFDLEIIFPIYSISDGKK